MLTLQNIFFMLLLLVLSILRCESTDGITAVLHGFKIKPIEQNDATSQSLPTIIEDKIPIDCSKVRQNDRAYVTVRVKSSHEDFRKLCENYWQSHYANPAQGYVPTAGHVPFPPYFPMQGHPGQQEPYQPFIPPFGAPQGQQVGPGQQDPQQMMYHTPPFDPSRPFVQAGQAFAIPPYLGHVSSRGQYGIEDAPPMINQQFEAARGAEPQTKGPRKPDTDPVATNRAERGTIAAASDEPVYPIRDQEGRAASDESIHPIRTQGLQSVVPPRQKQQLQMALQQMRQSKDTHEQIHALNAGEDLQQLQDSFHQEQAQTALAEIERLKDGLNQCLDREQDSLNFLNKELQQTKQERAACREEKRELNDKLAECSRQREVIESQLQPKKDIQSATNELITDLNSDYPSPSIQAHRLQQLIELFKQQIKQIISNIGHIQQEIIKAPMLSYHDDGNLASQKDKLNQIKEGLRYLVRGQGLDAQQQDMITGTAKADPNQYNRQPDGLMRDNPFQHRPVDAVRTVDALFGARHGDSPQSILPQSITRTGPNQQQESMAPVDEMDASQNVGLANAVTQETPQIIAAESFDTVVPERQSPDQHVADSSAASAEFSRDDGATVSKDQQSTTNRINIENI